MSWNKENIEHYFKEHKRVKILLQIAIIALVCWIFYHFSLGINYIFLAVFVLIIINVLKPSSRSRFLKMQAILPTSNVRSVAMGFAELKGNAVAKDLINSPYFSKPCIGYKYEIAKRSEDRDGDVSYHTIHSEIVCADFILKDESGQMDVFGKGIDFHMMKVDAYEGHLKRHSETYLMPDQEIFIIGYAASDNGKTILRHEASQKIFGIAPPDDISLWNKYNPLLKSFTTTLFCITIIILYILIS